MLDVYTTTSLSLSICDPLSLSLSQYVTLEMMEDDDEFLSGRIFGD